MVADWLLLAMCWSARGTSWCVWRLVSCSSLRKLQVAGWCSCGGVVKAAPGGAANSTPLHMRLGVVHCRCTTRSLCWLQLACRLGARAVRVWVSEASVQLAFLFWLGLSWH